MSLVLPPPPASFKSATQKIRVSSELWAEQFVACPACGYVAGLERLPNNYRSADLRCRSCCSLFQLKAVKNVIPQKITGASYKTTMESFKKGKPPSLLLMAYDQESWTVNRLLFLPAFLFPRSSIVPRPPLSSTARRAGWVGCTIDLSTISEGAFIPLVEDGVFAAANSVASSYGKLKEIEPRAMRTSWISEVYNIVCGMQDTFRTKDLYAYEDQLSRVYENNHFIKDKIRQQLQFLRDRGFLKSIKRGFWQKQT